MKRDELFLIATIIFTAFVIVAISSGLIGCQTDYSSEGQSEAADADFGVAIKFRAPSSISLRTYVCQP